MNRTALLVVLLAALAGCIALELWPQHAEESAMPASSPRPPVPAPASAPADIPGGAVAAILARPLFAPDRRPVAAAASGPAILPRLTGIIIENGRKTALFAAAGEAKPLALSVDGRVAGFTVQRIDSGEVTLAGPGGTRTLRPSFDPAAPAPTSLPPVLPPATIPGLTGSPSSAPVAR